MGILPAGMLLRMRSAAIGAVLLAGANASAVANSRPISFEDRIAAQRAIEDVYWRHRIWPKGNAAPKPTIDRVMSRSMLQDRVESYLRKSNALDVLWRRALTPEQLQAEINRMVRDSRDRQVLRELFDALHDDPELIAETLARQTLADRLTRSWHPDDYDGWWSRQRVAISKDLEVPPHAYTIPEFDPVACTNDTWTPTPTELPDARMAHLAVWTGSEMIVWGGYMNYGGAQGGGRYDPATDTWRMVSLGPGAPSARTSSSVVWTGSEMIVWGGMAGLTALDTGARYNPTTDTWTPTSTGPGVPTARMNHTAVWTGSRMIVWGGSSFRSPSPVGGARYDPVSDTWTPVSDGPNAPRPRDQHVALWTGTAMIVWGGFVTGTSGGPTNDGGRYDPVSDTWSPTSMSANVPEARVSAAAIWTGSEMIVWGGRASPSATTPMNSGGRYDPGSDTWQPTSLATDVPSPREGFTMVWSGSRMIVWGGGGSSVSPVGATYDPVADVWSPIAPAPFGTRSAHTAVWTGTEMIVWGGGSGSSDSFVGDTGARYRPSTDSWVLTGGSVGAPLQRDAPTAVWTGSEMIVWGGWRYPYSAPDSSLNTGARYTPAIDTWVPTSVGDGVPAPQGQAAGVWTGSEMIVWGGKAPTGVATGGRYDPAADTWRPTSTGAGAPSARPVPLAVWTGKEMIVAGNGNDNGSRYVPVADAWRPVAAGPGSGFPTAAVWSGTEMLVWNGGLAEGGRYDPTADSWSTFPSGSDILGTRLNASAVWDGHELIVWGGTRSDTGVQATGARYSPSTNSWTPTGGGPNLPAPRWSHTAIWTGSEMLIWGGEGTEPGSPGGRYDPATDRWSVLSNGDAMPRSRSTVASVWTGRQMIVWGGWPPTGTGGLYCACPAGAMLFRDADGDGFGDAASATTSCDGTVDPGYALNATDCDDAVASAHPGAAETCNARDDDCDGLVDESLSGEDSDGDGAHEVCDTCPHAWSSTQTDSDHDGEGDACDLDDGLLYEWRPDASTIAWQQEAGPTSWNVYVGDLDVLKATGVYAQAPGSNALASRQCGVTSTVADDLAIPSPGKASFSLVAGVTGGVEGGLGESTSGPRPNANPCP